MDTRHDKYAACVPVDDSGEVNKAARHGNVGDVHRPHLIRSLYVQVPQQVWIDAVRWMFLAGVGLAIQRLNAHTPHQRAHVTTANLDTSQGQQVAQHPATGKRVVQVQAIDEFHQRQIAFTDRPRLVIHTASTDGQRLGLAGQRQCVAAVDHRFAFSKPALVSAPSKKSFSNVSSPILACNDFTSIGGEAVAGDWPKTSDILSNS